MAFLNNGTMVSNEQFFQTIENYFISDTSPERTLFLAVILQASDSNTSLLGLKLFLSIT